MSLARFWCISSRYRGVSCKTHGKTVTACSSTPYHIAYLSYQRLILNIPLLSFTLASFVLSRLSPVTGESVLASSRKQSFDSEIPRASKIECNPKCTAFNSSNSSDSDYGDLSRHLKRHSASFGYLKWLLFSRNSLERCD